MAWPEALMQVSIRVPAEQADSFYFGSDNALFSLNPRSSGTSGFILVAHPAERELSQSAFQRNKRIHKVNDLADMFAESQSAFQRNKRIHPCVGWSGLRPGLNPRSSGTSGFMLVVDIDLPEGVSIRVPAEQADSYLGDLEDTQEGLNPRSSGTSGFIHGSPDLPLGEVSIRVPAEQADSFDDWCDAVPERLNPRSSGTSGFII